MPFAQCGGNGARVQNGACAVCSGWRLFAVLSAVAVLFAPWGLLLCHLCCLRLAMQLGSGLESPPLEPPMLRCGPFLCNCRLRWNCDGRAMNGVVTATVYVSTAMKSGARCDGNILAAMNRGSVAMTGILLRFAVSALDGVEKLQFWPEFGGLTMCWHGLRCVAPRTAMHRAPRCDAKHRASQTIADFIADRTPSVTQNIALEPSWRGV